MGKRQKESYGTLLLQSHSPTIKHYNKSLGHGTHHLELINPHNRVLRQASGKCFHPKHSVGVGGL
jgi:hypothetical protein